ncbi:MAG: glycosyltransferase family 4 protein, partial [Rhodoplanes sp.]
KGTDVFVQAMCRLLPRYPDFSAVVIGRMAAEHGAFAADLQRQVAAAGLADRFRFMGELPIDEVPRWYQALTIYVFASRNEGFGLTLIEAMAAGCALVAARAGAADKVVADGETGLLIPPGDVDALVAALEPLMRDPAQASALGMRARERVLSVFSIEAEADGIVAVYRALWQAMAAQAR